MKVKIFKNSNSYKTTIEFENEINEFIKDKKIIDIKYQEYTLYTGYHEPDEMFDGDIIWNIEESILVLYEDKED